MHGAGFHKYNKQRTYLPLWLRGENAHSICSLSFQLSIDYAVKQLTTVPVTEDDIRFTWVQVSGAEPLEFSDYHTPRPFIILNPDVNEDLHFKVYIDKDEATELVTDVWVYRTPTEQTLQYIDSLNAARTQGLSVELEPANSTPANIRRLLPEEVTIIENLKNSQANTQEDVLSFKVLADRVEPTSSLLGAKIIRFEAYETETGGLVGLSTDGSLELTLPKYVSTFYLKAVVSIYNGFENVTPKTYTITSDKVYSTPVRNFEMNLQIIRLYAQEGSNNTSFDGYNSSAGTISKKISLPSTVSIIESISPIEKAVPSNVGKTVKKHLTAKNVLGEEELSDFNTATIINQDVKLTRHIIRYNGITIGG